MPPITNDFTWSISRAKVFATCRRRYYYCYYGSWMGWDVQGPPEARLLYRLKQMMTLPMWAGKIVHRVIELAIKRARQSNPMTLEQMQTLARKLLNEEWRESTERMWMRHPKKYVNLFEHYYGREVTAERRAALREKIFAALEGYFQLGCASELATVPPEKWLSVEELKSFDAGGVKVWVVMDCAFRRNGEYIIYDWKTGAPSEHEAATDQLICYALFGMQEWKAPLESIRASLVHLPAQQLETFSVQAEQLIEFRERLYKSASEMVDCLADKQKNLAFEGDFPKTANEQLCRDCEYQEVCGVRSAEGGMMKMNDEKDTFRN